MTIHEARLQLIYALMPVYEDREAANIADLVLEKITGWSRIDRVINKDVSLSLPQQSLLENYTARLAQREPVQYVLEEAWFAGSKFFVDKSVLIPRPETEELVDWIIADARRAMPGLADTEIEASRSAIKGLQILDIGTGSGCIPIGLKKKIPGAAVTAIDVCSEALYVALSNATSHETEIDFKLLDFLNLQERDQLGRFDIIISNPPYIPEKDKTEIRANVLQWEPHKALFVPDHDPLLFYRAIAGFAKTHLTPGGVIYMEIHESQGKAVTELFRSEGYVQPELRKDMQGKDRMIKVSSW